MIDKPPKPQGEEPRSEPEVIPPGQGRVYIGKPSPLGAILLTLVVGLLSAMLMVLLFGALLVALPAVVLLITAAIVAGLLRVYFQRAP
jgi:hypothetical protein